MSSHKPKSRKPRRPSRTRIGTRLKYVMRQLWRRALTIYRLAYPRLPKGSRKAFAWALVKRKLIYAAILAINIVAQHLHLPESGFILWVSGGALALELYHIAELVKDALDDDDEDDEDGNAK